MSLITVDIASLSYIHFVEMLTDSLQKVCNMDSKREEMRPTLNTNQGVSGKGPVCMHAYTLAFLDFLCCLANKRDM